MSYPVILSGCELSEYQHSSISMTVMSFAEHVMDFHMTNFILRRITPDCTVLEFIAFDDFVSICSRIVKHIVLGQTKLIYILYMNNLSDHLCCLSMY